jgi:glycosyltransferase involved in cell wall biosynthesis
MPELYSAADVFVLPSLSEAHPWSLLEAMSCELAVTASRVGGIPETIPTESLLVDPSKPQEIAEKMQYLAENPDLRKHLGSENRKTILEKFTFKSHLAELATIYERLLE